MLKIQSAYTKLLYSTARISADRTDGSRSVGTAFFFTFKIDDKRNLPLLITNKHVISGAKTAEFLLHEAVTDSQGNVTGPASSSFSISINQFEQAWFLHPNPDVDLCAMPFEPIRQHAEVMGKRVFSIPIDDSLIPGNQVLDDLSAMEDVVMVGYPIGLWDVANNLPILRRGSTACHPALDFQGNPFGLVDMACFPGSSGSPILLLNEGGYTTAQGFSVGSRAYLLGVLFAGPVFKADGTIEVVDIPTHSVAVSKTQIPVHLGYYVKAAELLSLKGALVSACKIT